MVKPFAALALLIAVSAVSAAQRPPNEMTQVVKQGAREIVITSTFSASRQAVFRAFTDSARIPLWMSTEGLQLTSCSIDLRVGGALRFAYEMPKGRQIEVHGVFAAVDPPRSFTYLESYDFSPLTIDVTTSFSERGQRTLFTQTLLYRTEQDRDTDFPNIASSMPGAHARLERHLQSDE